MNTSQITQSPEETLKILEKFGFKFFGHNESNLPLVLAPNGQAVDINTAYKFLQTQLNEAQASANNIEGGISYPSIESVNFPESMDALEKGLERGERKVESSSENSVESTSFQKTVTSPKMTLDENTESPYGDGYSKFKKVDLDLRNPQNIVKLENFIKTNAKKDNSDPLKWLSHMFQKTLQELSEQD